jgi:hypothetical protein
MLLLFSKPHMCAYIFYEPVYKFNNLPARIGATKLQFKKIVSTLHLP